jgi:serine phosphatase RsbU (regulator of sigma subunit)
MRAFRLEMYEQKFQKYTTGFYFFSNVKSSRKYYYNGGINEVLVFKQLNEWLNFILWILVI